MTNQSMLFMNQNVNYSHPVDVTGLGAGFANARVWRATINEPGARNYAEFFGFFNLDDKPVTLRASWKQLGLDGGKAQCAESVERGWLQGVERSDSDSAGAWQYDLRDSIAINRGLCSAGLQTGCRVGALAHTNIISFESAISIGCQERRPCDGAIF